MTISGIVANAPSISSAVLVRRWLVSDQNSLATEPSGPGSADFAVREGPFHTTRPAEQPSRDDLAESLARQLLQAGLIQDVYLTTSPRAGGQPNTPLEIGHANLVIRKRGTGADAGVVFEQTTSVRA